MSRYYTVAILCLTVFFLFADQNLMAPNLSAIAKDFGFSDKERDEKLGGFIAFGFFIIGGPVALLVGYFADTCNRCMLFALVVTFGEGACFATYFVRSYPELLLCRILTGISIGGSTPIIFSLLGDLFPESSRVYVSTLIGIAMSSGIAGGQLLAGVVGPPCGWRLPFLLVSIPAIICGNLVVLTVKEPLRGSQEQAVRAMKQESRASSGQTSRDVAEDHSNKNTDEEMVVNGCKRSSMSQSYQSLQHSASSLEVKLNERQTCDQNLSDEEQAAAAQHSHELTNVEGDGAVALAAAAADYSERIEWRKLVALFRTPSVVLIFVQGLPGCLPWGMVYVFLNDYLSSDRGMSVQAATLALTCFGVGGLFGQLWGGWYGQRLYNRDPCHQCVLMGATTVLSVFPMLYLVVAPASGGGFFAVAVLAGALVSINGPNVRTVLQVSASSKCCWYCCAKVLTSAEQNVCIPEVRGCAFAVFMLTDDLGKGLGPGERLLPAFLIADGFLFTCLLLVFSNRGAVH